MNSTIKELAEQCYEKHPLLDTFQFNTEKFARLVIQECINKIETYRIPVGNSASGELACEWTYEALKEIRDQIKETFGVE
jgi:tetrahydromethanopterin S-methyltransferase subunit H